MRKLKVGLALGAGGTKGSAHVGVIKVLEEAGVEIEAVAGSSIGALYGGAYATGRTAAEIEHGVRNNPRREVISFFRHRLKIRHDNRLARRFYAVLAGHMIEDLPIRFACTASDIATRTPVVITSGPLIDAIEASIAIPILARPVMHQGRYLLDGGFWEAAPVGAAAGLGADLIVAVELGHPYTLPRRLHRPAAWLEQRLARLPIARTVAGVPFTLHAVGREHAPGRTADIVVRPDLTGMGSSSPFHMTRALDAGIAAAREALPAIRALLAGEPAPAVAEEYAPHGRLLPELAS